MNISPKIILQKLKLRYGSQETVANTLREMGLRIGERSRVYTLRFPSEPYLIRLGNDCVIAPDVTFVTHNANTMFQNKHESLTGFGKIDIKDNSYVGVNATILPNVTIGPNSLVGAGSVVTKDVPPDTVVAGNPARIICTIDEYEKKCIANHLDVPEDRESLRVFLEQHFWGEED